MKVGRIDNQEGRVLLYASPTPGNDDEYHVIAKANCPVNIGDTIEYEPFGWNFGWLVEAEQHDEGGET